MHSEKLSKFRCSRKRKLRIRKNLRGTAAKPRLCVVKSNRHLQVQLVDDDLGKTLASCSTFSKEYRAAKGPKARSEAAEKMGSFIAEAAKKLGIERIVFDRGAKKFGKVLAALASAARKEGLQF